MPIPETQDEQQANALSMDETLRIMDVATALRQQRELVHQQLNVDQLKDQLRRQLQETADVSGEPLTKEEIDTAVANYFDNLHTFREPPRSMRLTLAYLYIRRGRVAAIAGVFPVAALLVWWVCFR